MPPELERRKENALGVANLISECGEFVADEWHSTYEGAPDDGSSWGSAPGVLRGASSLWEDPLEILTLHVAIRRGARGESAGCRLAISI